MTISEVVKDQNVKTMTELGSERAFNKMFDAFMALEKDKIVYCNMPLEIAAAEAKQLGIVAAEDRQMLIDAGINSVYVDSLLDRAGAFMYASAKYNTVVNASPEARRLWEEFSPVGYEVQKYLVRFFSFAFRKDESLLKSVDKIKEGRGDKDMIMDLLSSHIFANENLAALTSMNMFDQTKIEEAKTLHNKLSEIYAKSNLDPKQVNKAKETLHHAYTYYKQAADEVTDHGKFVFEGTDRYDAYVSEYRSGNRKKTATKTDDNTKTAPAVASI